MPTRLKRYDEPGHVHFWTISCYHRLSFFWNDHIKQVAIAGLSHIRETHRICLTGYVIMPEHVHVLLYPHAPGSDVPIPVSTLLHDFKEFVGREGNAGCGNTGGARGACGRHRSTAGLGASWAIRRSGTSAVTTSTFTVSESSRRSWTTVIATRLRVAWSIVPSSGPGAAIAITSSMIVRCSRWIGTGSGRSSGNRDVSAVRICGLIESRPRPVGVGHPATRPSLAHRVGIGGRVSARMCGLLVLAAPPVRTAVTGGPPRGVPPGRAPTSSDRSTRSHADARTAIPPAASALRPSRGSRPSA
jgi:hypothetical protein